MKAMILAISCLLAVSSAQAATLVLWSREESPKVNPETGDAIDYSKLSSIKKFGNNNAEYKIVSVKQDLTDLSLLVIEGEPKARNDLMKPLVLVSFRDSASLRRMLVDFKAKGVLDVTVPFETCTYELPDFEAPVICRVKASQAIYNTLIP